MNGAFGKFLIGLGGLWAVIGVLNLVSMFEHIATTSSALMTFGLIFNMCIFVLPGAICAGIGARLTT